MLYRLFIALTLLLLNTACITRSPVVRNLQDVKIDGSVPGSAIHIVDDRQPGKTEVTPYLRINRDRKSSTRLDGHTMVNGEGVFETIETTPEEFIEQANVNTMPYEGNNFSWEQPAYQAGIDIVVPLSKLVAFTGAFETSSINERSTYALGLGLNLAIVEKNWSGEIIGMIRTQKLYYQAEVVEVEDKSISGSETRRVRFYSLDNETLYFNPSIALTVNGRNPDWVLHPFANIEFGSLDLTRLDEHLPEDSFTAPVTSSTNLTRRDRYVGIAGGFYIKLSSSQKVLFGLRRKTFGRTDSLKPVTDGFVQFTTTFGGN